MGNRPLFKHREEQYEENSGQTLDVINRELKSRDRKTGWESRCQEVDCGTGGLA